MAVQPKLVIAVAGVAMLVAIAGCKDQSLAPVTGAVSIDGQPVSTGEVYFSPIASKEDKFSVGKPSYSKIASDGSYELGTFQPGDGACVGKHRVALVDVEHKTSKGDISFGRLFIQGAEFEVLPGQPNIIDLKLTSEMIRKYATAMAKDD